MAVPTVTPVQNYHAAFGDEISVSNLVTARDTVSSEVISQWVFKEDGNSPHGFLYIKPTASSAAVFQPEIDQWVHVSSGLVAPGHDVTISNADLISGNLVYLTPANLQIGQSVSDRIYALAGDASGWSRSNGTVFTTVTTTLSPFLHGMNS